MEEGIKLLPKQTFPPAFAWKTEANLGWPHSKYSAHAVAKFSRVQKKNNLTSSCLLRHTANGQVGYKIVALCFSLAFSPCLLQSLPLWESDSTYFISVKPGGGHSCSICGVWLASHVGHFHSMVQNAEVEIINS